MKNGWFKESHRHSLAARGVKTNRYMATTTQRPNVAERFFESRRRQISPEARQRNQAKLQATEQVARQRAIKPATDKEVSDLIRGIQTARTRARPGWKNWVEEDPGSLAMQLKVRRDEFDEKALNANTNFERNRFFEEVNKIDDIIEKVQEGVEPKEAAGFFSRGEIDTIRRVVNVAENWGRYLPEDEISRRLSRNQLSPEDRAFLKRKMDEEAEAKKAQNDGAFKGDSGTATPTPGQGPGDDPSTGGAGNTNPSQTPPMTGFMTSDAFKAEQPGPSSKGVSTDEILENFKENLRKEILREKTRPPSFGSRPSDTYFRRRPLDGSDLEGTSPAFRKAAMRRREEDRLKDSRIQSNSDLRGVDLKELSGVRKSFEEVDGQTSLRDFTSGRK